MGRSRSALLTAGLAGLAVMGAAGCGGGDDGGGAGTTAAAQAPAPAATTPAATTPAPAATTPAATTPAKTTPAPATSAPASAGKAVPASDPVAQAAVLASKLHGGVAIQMRGTVSANGEASPITGKGTVDRRTGRGMFNLTTGVHGQAVPIREVMDGHALYITSAAFTGRLPGKKSWMRIDLSKAGKTEGFDLSSLGTNGPSQDPSQVLDYLAGAGASKKAGTATVHGVATTRYKVDVNLAKAKAKATSAASKRSLGELAKTVGGAKASLPVEVWLDAQHRVLRERVHYSATIGGITSALDFTTDFTDYGAPVKVNTPAASDTVDGLDLLSKANALKQEGA
jgi:hypothetical protein